jgi:hypothetical protein
LETKGKDLQGIVMQFGLGKRRKTCKVLLCNLVLVKEEDLHFVDGAIWSWKKEKTCTSLMVQFGLGSNQRKGKICLPTCHDVVL